MAQKCALAFRHLHQVIWAIDTENGPSGSNSPFSIDNPLLLFPLPPSKVARQRIPLTEIKPVNPQDTRSVFTEKFEPDLEADRIRRRSKNRGDETKVFVRWHCYAREMTKPLTVGVKCISAQTAAPPSCNPPRT